MHSSGGHLWQDWFGALEANGATQGIVHGLKVVWTGSLRANISDRESYLSTNASPHTFWLPFLTLVTIPIGMLSSKQLMSHPLQLLRVDEGS